MEKHKKVKRDLLIFYCKIIFLLYLLANNCSITKAMEQKEISPKQCENDYSELENKTQSQVNSSVQNKLLAENLAYVNVKEFGAIGDGVHDDTEAVLSAISSSNNVYFPAGIYIVSKAIDLQNDFYFFGDGKKISVIKFSETIKEKKDDYLVNIVCDNFIITDLSFVYETTTENENNQFLQKAGIMFKIQSCKKSGLITNCSFECLNNGQKFIMTPLWLRSKDIIVNVAITNCDIINTGTIEQGGVLWISCAAENSTIDNINISENYLFTKNRDESLAIWFHSENNNNTFGNIYIHHNTFENNNDIVSTDNIVSVNNTSENANIIISDNKFIGKGGFNLFFKLNKKCVFSNNYINIEDTVNSDSFWSSLVRIRDDNVSINNNTFYITTKAVLRLDILGNCNITDNTFVTKQHQFFIENKGEEKEIIFERNIFDIDSKSFGIGINYYGTLEFLDNNFTNNGNFYISSPTVFTNIVFEINKFSNLEVYIQKNLNEIEVINNVIDNKLTISNTSADKPETVTILNNSAKTMSVLDKNWNEVTDKTMPNIAENVCFLNNKLQNGEVWKPKVTS